ncbi:MAG: hypothetical protein KDA92_24530 [Planctomycetales bacterium]|nr:hypothetical protein [Planctomycetales bacterium]
MKYGPIQTWLTIALVTTVFTPVSADELRGMSFLDNGTIRVGVNLDIGGAITFLAPSTSQENIINSHDWGRQVQMSFYSGPTPFVPNGKEPNATWRFLGWNPIQAGDCYGHGSRVVAHQNDGTTLYVKCVPMQWPLNNEPGECTFESWLSLKGPTVHVRSQLNNARSDHTQYAARGQELPAIYTNGNYYRLFTYAGAKPFTGDKLRQITKVWRSGAPDQVAGGPWDHWYATENWAALVRDDDFGVGIWSPGTYSFIGGFAGEPGKGGPKDAPTGYIAPLRAEVLDHNIQYAYEYELIVGTLTDIRAYVQSSRTNSLPNYTFRNDRQSWTLRNCTDAGWPIESEWTVHLDDGKPLLVGPDAYWSAEKVPTIYLRAAFETQQDTARLAWEQLNGPGGDIRFSVEPDGKMHTYEISLAANTSYQGTIKRLLIRPVDQGTKGATVRIESIGCERPE